MRKVYLLVIKPVLDFIIALIILVVLSPIFIIITLILSIDFKGNPLFFQARNGKNGKEFKVIKFKTMNDKKDAHGNLLPNEFRLTPLGKLVRKSSLDELPQMLNVIKGEMSFIGPRPLPVRYYPFFDTEEKKRFLVKPGITGWAQVAGRNQLFWDKRLKLDVEYAERASFLFDIKIVLMTIYKVISAKENEVNAASKMIDFDKYKKSLINEPR